jgi:3-oxoacyl-[acyl-carrier-protein] synthase II
MSCYVNGIGAILPQKQLTVNNLLSEPVDQAGERLTCIEPDYGQYFDVRQLRRMSRIIRMGMAAGMDALREAGLQVPDGIITGTGYGCLDDTGIFLSKMVDNQEQALNPTPFIQSTHNTIGSQLALMLQCQGYNQTYTQRALSFENALTDAVLTIMDDPTQRLLTGAADEITNISHDVLRRFGIFRHDSMSSLNLFKTKATGTLNGEGAAYFLVSGSPEPGAVELKGVQSFYNITASDLISGIAEFLHSHAIRPDEIDVVFSGVSGHAAFDAGLNALIEGQFPVSTRAAFKHLSGEFPSASAIAMAIACRAIQGRSVPQVVIQRDAQRTPNRVLIYNRYFNTYHSLILLASS